jgi:hypothetical protein
MNRSRTAGAPAKTFTASKSAGIDEYCTLPFPKRETSDCAIRRSFERYGCAEQHGATTVFFGWPEDYPLIALLHFVSASRIIESWLALRSEAYLAMDDFDNANQLFSLSGCGQRHEIGDLGRRLLRKEPGHQNIAFRGVHLLTLHAFKFRS